MYSWLSYNIQNQAELIFLGRACQWLEVASRVQVCFCFLVGMLVHFTKIHWAAHWRFIYFYLYILNSNKHGPLLLLQKQGIQGDWGAAQHLSNRMLIHPPTVTLGLLGPTLHHKTESSVFLWWMEACSWETLLSRCQSQETPRPSPFSTHPCQAQA